MTVIKVLLNYIRVQKLVFCLNDKHSNTLELSFTLMVNDSYNQINTHIYKHKTIYYNDLKMKKNKIIKITTLNILVLDVPNNYKNTHDEMNIQFI